MSVAVHNMRQTDADRRPAPPPGPGVSVGSGVLVGSDPRVHQLAERFPAGGPYQGRMRCGLLGGGRFSGPLRFTVESVDCEGCQ